MNVWCLGGGMIGQFAAQSARAAGARVTVSEIDDRRLQVAAEVGAHLTLNARDGDFWDRLKEGGPYNAILDSSGVEGLLPDIAKNLLDSYGVNALILNEHQVRQLAGPAGRVRLAVAPEDTDRARQVLEDDQSGVLEDLEE